MGTWAAGSFDNDHAADWGSDLHDASPDDRAAMVRSALTAEDGYVDAGDGQIAVAAIAIVAAVRTGQIPSSAYWPDFLTAGEGLSLPDDVTALALSALDRVTGEESELQELWTEDGPNETWESEIASLRTALTR